MNVEVREAHREDPPVLRRLMQLYLYDLGTIDGWDLGDDGLYGIEARIEGFWTDPDRRSFLVRVDGKLAGFALVRDGAHFAGGGTREISEFFILRRYRRRGAGGRGGPRGFAPFPGPGGGAPRRGQRPGPGGWRGGGRWPLRRGGRGKARAAPPHRGRGARAGGATQPARAPARELSAADDRDGGRLRRRCRLETGALLRSHRRLRPREVRRALLQDPARGGRRGDVAPAARGRSGARPRGRAHRRPGRRPRGGAPRRRPPRYCVGGGGAGAGGWGARGGGGGGGAGGAPPRGGGCGGAVGGGGGGVRIAWSSSGVARRISSVILAASSAVPSTRGVMSRSNSDEMRRIGMSFRNGMPRSSRVILSWMRPPRTSV